MSLWKVLLQPSCNPSLGTGRLLLSVSQAFSSLGWVAQLSQPASTREVFQPFEKLNGPVWTYYARSMSFSFGSSSPSVKGGDVKTHTHSECGRHKICATPRLWSHVSHPRKMCKHREDWSTLFLFKHTWNSQRRRKRKDLVAVQLGQLCSALCTQIWETLHQLFRLKYMNNKSERNESTTSLSEQTQSAK